MVGLMMTSFSEKMLISNRCLRGLMPNLIKKSVTVSILEGRVYGSSLVSVGAMGALAPTILRENFILSNCMKKLLGIWENSINTEHPKFQILTRFLRP